MVPAILVSSLLLAAAPGDTQDTVSGTPPTAQDSAPAPPSRTRKPRTTSPPGTTPMPPMPNVDRGIQLPPNKTPEAPKAPSQPDKPAPDAAQPNEDSVKPVPAAPSKPGEPGVRPL